MAMTSSTLNQASYRARREISDTILVFGEGDDRYDIPYVGDQVCRGQRIDRLPFYEIGRKHKVDRQDRLPARSALFIDLPEAVDLATYQGKYPKSIFNKGVRTQDEEHVGRVMKETDDKIVVCGHYDWRFDVPKSEIIAVGRNVILGMNYSDLFKYRVERDARLPTGEPVDGLAE